MPGRAIRTTSRIAFLLCGLISLFTAAPYALLRGVDLPVQSEWIIFVVALALVGVFSVVVGLLPRSRIANCSVASRRFSISWPWSPISLRTAGISIPNLCFRCVRCIS